MLLNYALLIGIVLLLIAVILIYFISSSKVYVPTNYINEYSIEYLVDGVQHAFSTVLKQNLRDMNLTKAELDKKESLRSELKKALRESAYGNKMEKEFVKSYIKDIIQGPNFKVNQQTIDRIIHFDNPNELTSQDMFEILLYMNSKVYGQDTLSQLIKEYGLSKPQKDEATGEDVYQITEADIRRIYKSKMKGTTLSYDDKLEVVAQRIFQRYKGFGPIDILINTSIDGISGGVSGVPSNSFEINTVKSIVRSYESIWIMYSGISIQLKCISFGSQAELERVCKNIYKYNSPGTLSESKGYIVNVMKNGSRVVVVRPPFAESWAFWIRKFDSTPSVAPEDLIRDRNSQIPIGFVKWGIKGCRNIAITGSQGTGKSTFLKSIIRFIDPAYTLRIQELSAELNLRYTYPNRNISSFVETPTVSSQDGLNLQKKTDGSVNIIGEVASDEAASWIIQTSMVASLFSLFTHHAKTTYDLVIAIRNSLLKMGGFSNEKIAEEQVAKVLNLDVHLTNVKGHRFIQRITEIIPIREHEYPVEDVLASDNPIDISTEINQNEYFKRVTDRQLFRTVDLVRYENDRYVFVNMPSADLIREIKKHLTEEEEVQFDKDMAMFKELSKSEVA